MIPLALSTGTFALARALGWAGLDPLDDWSVAAAVGLACMFLVTGTWHFVGIRRAGMVMMVPPRLAAATRLRPERLVSITGVLELLGAVGLLVPATRPPAAAALAVLLVAMFPANWYAQRTYPGTALVSMSLPARTAAQVWFVALCLVAALG